MKTLSILCEDFRLLLVKDEEASDMIFDLKKDIELLDKEREVLRTEIFNKSQEIANWRPK